MKDLDEMDYLVEQMYFAANKSVSLLVGLYFEDFPMDDTTPSNFQYRIRLPGSWSTEYEYPFLQLPGPGWSEERKLYSVDQQHSLSPLHSGVSITVDFRGCESMFF